MERKLWLDYLRAIACILVTLGHLLKSFLESNIICENVVISFFIQIIHHFHVYIFFFVSGYLFQQKYQIIVKEKEFCKYRIIRCFDFFIPYVVFSFITYFIKFFLSNDVNTPVNTSFLTVLFFEPISQMWYLYVSIILVLVVPGIKNKKFSIILLVAIFAKVLAYMVEYDIFIPLDYLIKNFMWFYLGMIWYYKRVKLKKKYGEMLAVIFLILSFFEYKLGISNVFFSMMMTLVSVIASVEIVRNITENKKSISVFWRICSRYMLQIYLLHTICAAGIRIILLRLNVTNTLIHFIFGLFFSFVLPIVCALIAEKLKVLNIVFFPSRTIKYLACNRNKKAESDL